MIGKEEVAEAMYERDLAIEGGMTGHTWLPWKRMVEIIPLQYEVTEYRERARAAMTAHLAALEAAGWMLISIADYKRLLEAAESDDMIEWCEVCGAWLDKDDPARVSAEDFTGCWKAATRDEKYTYLCRSYRALEVAPPAQNGDEVKR